MTTPNGFKRPPRTVLEQKIRERRETFEEFAEYAEKFARDHHEPATLSVRHLERLLAGRRGDGRPLGPVRPATARLLERIFDLPITELLRAPELALTDDSEAELRQRLSASSRVDTGTLDLLADQLNTLRRLDRQLGAIVSYREITTKASQMTHLLEYSLSPAQRVALAALLAETQALAAWAALDLGETVCSWQHHECAKSAAREADSPALHAHAMAQQAVILLDLGEVDAAVRNLAGARSLASNSGPVLRAWLAAAHGEGLAAANGRDEALRAFDSAKELASPSPLDPAFPFVFLGEGHLARWRGHALALLNDREAADLLMEALRDLDPTFARAEVALRTDLAQVLIAEGDPVAAGLHGSRAWEVTKAIGSTRQAARLQRLRSKPGGWISQG